MNILKRSYNISHALAGCFISLICFFISDSAFGQMNGYVLYNEMNQNTTYLLDNEGNIAHSWSCDVPCNYTVKLKENGNIIRGGVYSGSALNGAAAGGIVQEYDPSGNVVWEFIYSDANHNTHHDLEITPQGTVFLIAWEVMSVSELTNAGFDNPTSEKWAHCIIEVQPDGLGGGEIIWEWHMKDHFIQDFDAGKSNYGVVADHPELFDINMISSSGGPGPGPGPGAEDWFHCNGIDYNPTLDQIIFSSRNASEIYIIDHSTTTLVAASHSGGNSGKGGDILYRWGNPSNYGAPGTQIVSDAVHDPRWIPEGRPYAGYIQLFNNSGNSGNSAVDLINPPLNGYNYDLTAGTQYAPTTYEIRHNCLASSWGQSASDRMSNGNLFVAVSGEYMYEVNPAGDVVWTYAAGPQKAFRYECEYEGIQNLLGDECGLKIEGNLNQKISFYPNPANNVIHVEGLAALENHTIQIVSLSGEEIVSSTINENNEVSINGISSGIYIIKIFRNEETVLIEKLIVQ